MVNKYSITWNGRRTNINGLPDKPIRNWNNNIKVKFYHRGRYTPTTFTKTGKIKKPRSETQLYINGKYFIQFSWNTSPDNEAKLLEMIQYLYCFGCELEEIKRIFKKCFYQN